LLADRSETINRGHPLLCLDRIWLTFAGALLVALGDGADHCG